MKTFRRAYIEYKYYEDLLQILQVFKRAELTFKNWEGPVNMQNFSPACKIGKPGNVAPAFSCLSDKVQALHPGPAVPRGLSALTL